MRRPPRFAEGTTVRVRTLIDPIGEWSDPNLRGLVGRVTRIEATDFGYLYLVDGRTFYEEELEEVNGEPAG